MMSRRLHDVKEASFGGKNLSRVIQDAEVARYSVEFIRIQ